MAWTAVYGSLMAADRALQAMSSCCRMPKATSCSSVRSKPIRTSAWTARSKSAASGRGSAAVGAHTQPSAVPATMCCPTRGRRQMVTPCSLAIGSSSSGWMVCT